MHSLCREHWPRWLLVAAVAAGMAAAAGGSRGAGTDTSFSSCGLPQGSVAGRLLFSLCAGLLVGGYISLELLPNQLVLQVLVTLATVLVVAFVVILQLPLGGGPVVLPLVSVAWAVCCSLALLLHAELPVSGLGQLEERLFPDSKQQVRRMRSGSGSVSDRDGRYPSPLLSAAFPCISACCIRSSTPKPFRTSLTNSSDSSTIASDTIPLTSPPCACFSCPLPVGGGCHLHRHQGLLASGGGQPCTAQGICTEAQGGQCAEGNGCSGKGACG